MKIIRHLLSTAALALLLSPALALAEGASSKPVPMRTPPPEYPAALRKENVTGLVVVKLGIDEKGKVSEATVVKSTEHRLERLALQAVLKWSFKPALQDGEAIASTMTIPIQFEIEG